MPTTHGAGVGQSPSPLRSCGSAEGGVRPCGALLPPRPLTEAEQKLAHLLLLQAPPPEPHLPQGRGPKALVCAQSGRRGPLAANSSTWGSIGVTTTSTPRRCLIATRCHQGWGSRAHAHLWPRGTPHKTLKAGSLTLLGGRGDLWDCPATAGHWKLVGSQGPPQGTLPQAWACHAPGRSVCLGPRRAFETQGFRPATA